jgi:hypothetical protein
MFLSDELEGEIFILATIKLVIISLNNQITLQIRLCFAP